MSDLVVDALATWRLTRLVTTDRITDPARVWVIQWAARRAPIVAEGIECDWCVSVYAGIVVQVLPRRVRYGLALAALAGIIADRTR